MVGGRFHKCFDCILYRHSSMCSIDVKLMTLSWFFAKVGVIVFLGNE